MRKSLSVIAFALAIAVVMAPQADAAKPASPAGLKRQLRQLQTANAKLVAASAVKDRTIAGLTFQIATLTPTANQVPVLQGQVTDLTAQLSGTNALLAQANADKTVLAGELPDRVGYIARTGDMNQLRSLVLTPAYNNWRCRGSVFVSSSLVDYEFDLPYNGKC